MYIWGYLLHIMALAPQADCRKEGTDIDMEWRQLLSARRVRRGGGNNKNKSTDLRSEFEKDYHRIIGSASFRRLQDKTQVFPLDKSDFIRTRLTHSLEVSSFAKSLGQNIGENILKYKKDPSFTPQMKEDICNILQCAGLIHDIGNPPFGHFGENAIREWFEHNLGSLYVNGQKVEDMLTPQMRGDFYHFEGNAQALRLVTRLHYLVDENGMNLTYALLNTIVKYPGSSIDIDETSGNIKDKKMGYYYADEAIYKEVERETGTNGNRHPLTFILEAADDLAYKTADIEDAFIKGFISYHTLKEELGALQDNCPDAGFCPLDELEKRYIRGVERGVDDPQEYAVKNWIVRVQGFIISCITFGFTRNYDAIMAGTYKKDLFSGTFGEKLMDLLGDMANRYVFMSSTIYKLELTEAAILDDLMEKFVHAAIHYDAGEKMDSIDLRIVSLISDNYKKAYRHQAEGKSEAEKIYLRLLLVTDYVCGMTDSYAKRLYQELNGII
ncbi:dGTPase [Hespellia stercorisuis DSM 15480]|uniref:dGTPase n=2 Tax=Hespellia stercorisuis TaxID=180311 RepID=A0A1M6J1N1_9FIRM|nr:dGTPase [Hespellia stercorisuis DSM 15480]